MREFARFLLQRLDFEDFLQRFRLTVSLYFHVWILVVRNKTNSWTNCFIQVLDSNFAVAIVDGFGNSLNSLVVDSTNSWNFIIEKVSPRRNESRQQFVGRVPVNLGFGDYIFVVILLASEILYSLLFSENF